MIGSLTSRLYKIQLQAFQNKEIKKPLRDARYGTPGMGRPVWDAQSDFKLDQKNLLRDRCVQLPL